MIFVTVGTQLPFDRLVKTIDEWAYNNNRNDIVAQIGDSVYQPIKIQFSKFMKPQEVDSYFKSSKIIIAHAGMGSIISAVKYKKPIIILPRLAAYGEHRNNHQIATGNRFEEFQNIYLAKNINELIAKLNDLETLLKTEIDSIKMQNELTSFLYAYLHKN